LEKELNLGGVFEVLDEGRNEMNEEWPEGKEMGCVIGKVLRYLRGRKEIDKAYNLMQNNTRCEPWLNK
jgi:hypothetical protein